MWCGICFCDSWKLTGLFTEQRGLSVPLFLPFFSAKRVVFALTEIKTGCDLSCQGLAEFLFVFDGWIQTKRNHPVSSGQKIETWVLHTAAVICHHPNSQVVKVGIMRGVVSLLTFKVSGCFVQDGYVHTPKPLWDIWHQNTSKNMKLSLCVWLRSSLWGQVWPTGGKCCSHGSEHAII